MANLDAIVLGDRANTQQAVLVVPAAAAANKPGIVVLQAVSDAGAVTDYYLWVDSNGKLRYHTSLPTDQDANGYIVNNDVVITTRLDSLTQTSDYGIAVSPVTGYLKAAYGVVNATCTNNTLAVEVYCGTNTQAAGTITFLTTSVYKSLTSVTQNSSVSAGQYVKVLVSDAATEATKLWVTLVISPTG